MAGKSLRCKMSNHVNKSILTLFSIKKLLFPSITRRIHQQIMETIEENTLADLCKKLPPKLSPEKYKGMAGRIGVIGGSLEYTGAPYFSGITALKVGADLSHIFCTKDAATVIKSYSPELIVHPLLDNLQTAQSAVQWIERLHVIVIGPGLGRSTDTFNATTVLVNECRRLKKPLVIDADGLFFLTNYPTVFENYPSEIILTPNAVEFQRLFKTDYNPEMLNRFGKKCTVIRKGRDDEIFDSHRKSKCTVKGSNRRCGGQGDLLSGSVATFLCWALNHQEENFKDLAAMVASYAACKLTKECNARAFEIHGRSMTTGDMIGQIGNVFKDGFELK